MPANEDPLIPPPGTVAVRLFGQGLGDCFLLAFPRPETPDHPCYMLIDCGAAASTPNGAGRMSQVVAAIHQATGGVIDVLVVTHQHFDHISSFLQARDAWKQMTVKALYLPWTEATNEREEAKTLGKLRDALNRAATAALERAAADGDLASHPTLHAEAGFLGIDPANFGAAGSAMGGTGIMDEAMQLARALCPGSIHYFEPGDVFRLPGAESHGYVLGPPLPSTLDQNKRVYVELLVDESQMYHYAQFPGMAADGGRGGTGDAARAVSLDADGLSAIASGLLALDAVSDAAARAGDDMFSPFDTPVRLEWDQAMSLDFFEKHYGGAQARGENGSWRRVDNDWLAGAATLALRAGDLTNNISLVLAFDIPGSDKMLLFPGDAQVGNWLSWHAITGWRLLGDARPANPPASSDDQTLMENLLGRVAFYKVGHHGSHNATIRQKGLELMTRPDLTAYIPVSVPVAQDLMGYCPMPFYPVVRRLQEKTQGRVFLANGQAVEPLPPGATQDALRAAATLTLSDATLDPKKQGSVTLEDAVPLYAEVTIAAG